MELVNGLYKVDVQNLPTLTVTVLSALINYLSTFKARLKG